MEAPPVVHPSLELLQGFGSGKLDNAVAARVQAHLETCAACRDTVAGLSGDSFLNRLRAARPEANTQSEARGPGDTAATPGAVPLDVPQPTAVRRQDIPVEFRDHPQYEVLFELDRGGMGVVYLARDRFMDRKTVLKVVNKKYFDRPEVQERFLREIRLAAQLSHDNIVRAYAALPLGELIVFAMEYVEGENLAKFVQRVGPLPVINASYYAYQAAQGLQHAFEKGLAHRDIKPQNLILTRQGKKHLVKILDFGLAKATREQQEPDAGLTGTGVMMGTPDYIAPEQTLDASRADIRSDVYSLGCTLYFLLAGRPPFKAGSVYALIQAHHQSEATPLHQLRSDVPRELAAVAAKMMAKEPSQRYQKPAEVVEALKPFARGPLKALPAPPIAPRPEAAKAASQIKPVLRPTAIEGTALPGPKRPRKWLLAPLAGLLLAGLFISLWAGGVFRLKTAEGTLVVEVNEPNPDVYVDGDKMTVTWGNDGKQAEIRLKPGTRKVEVRKAGFTVFGEEVQLAEGKRQVLTARLVSSPYKREAPALPGGLENSKPPVTKEVDRPAAALPGGLENSKPPVTKEVDRPAARPPLVDCTGSDGVSEAAMHKAQEAWAAYLGRQVEEEDEIAGGVKMQFVLIPPGKFLMGSPEDEKERSKDEVQHEVTITKPFYIARYTVTQSQYEALTGKSPSNFKGANLPVEQVSWEQADAFAKDWTRKAGGKLVYRLPMEAEWEYSCRGGRPLSQPFGIGGGTSLSSDQANFDGNYPYGGADKGEYREKTTPVGTFRPNALGLYDMHGNVWQWCGDWYGECGVNKQTDPTGPPEGSYRVIRGGSWNNNARFCRAAYRRGGGPGLRSSLLGFRLARVPSSSGK